METPRLARRVMVAGLALIAMIILAEGHGAWLDRRETLADNEHAQKALVRLLEEQAARMIQETDVVLSDYGQWVASAEGRQATPEQLRERLQTDVMRLPFVASASLAGVNGRVFATTRNADPGSEVVEIPATALTNTLYIGAPFVGPLDGKKTFAVSRRIVAPNGGFTCVVAAHVAFDYLTTFYSNVDLSPDTSIRLLRDDGVELTSYMGDDATQPDKSTATRVVVPPLEQGEKLTYRVSGGHEEVAAIHRVEGYPLVVEVTRPLNSVLREWADDQTGVAIRMFVLVALAAALAWALRTALIRQARQEQEHRRLERDLEIAHRMDALGFLAASVAHDFNNVLSAIVGYAELARQSVSAESSGLASMDRLLAATERARELIRRVLTFDPKRSIEYAPLALKPILEEVAQQIEATLPPTMTLRTTGLELPAFVCGDSTEIHQVVMNLCTNAVHAMPTGGRLEIELSRAEFTEVRTVTVGRVMPGSWCCVTIADSGVGLTSEQIGSIFEPFYSIRGSEQGTGIGLTVVSNIMTRMRGALDVQSSVGKGTRICVYWPSASADTAAAEMPIVAGTSGHGETVMVVDDEPELVSLTEEVLASLGYEPVGFTGSRAALRAFRAQPQRFDALVTDQRMQELDGCALAKRIHKIDARLPIIMVTGYRDVDTMQRARDAGIVEILDKPLNTQTLAAALSRQLSASSRPARAVK